MSSNSPIGPFYVLFDADRTTILYSRPERVALGAAKPMLPVVITCAFAEDAQVVLRLKKHVFDRNPRLDAHTLAYLVQEAPHDVIMEKIYCVRRGGDATSKTGIWIGFNWGDVECNVDADRKKAKWHRQDTLKAGIIYMLRKAGHNIPLVAAGEPIPPPRPPAPPSTPAPADARRPATVGTQPATPSRLPRNAAVATPQREGGNRPSASTGDADGDVFYDALALLSVEDQTRPATQSAAIRLLARLISPLPSMRSSSLEPRRLPITFGPLADEILALKGMSSADLLTVLAARVYSDREEVFSHHVGLALGWTPLEAVTLWRAMEFPDI